MSAISEKRKALEEASPPVPLGTPTSGELSGPDGGAYQHFENASIYWSPATGAHVVQDAILTKYLELDGPNGILGYPLTDHTHRRVSCRRTGTSKATHVENG